MITCELCSLTAIGEDTDGWAWWPGTKTFLCYGCQVYGAVCLHCGTAYDDREIDEDSNGAVCCECGGHECFVYNPDLFDTGPNFEVKEGVKDAAD
jgi:hypothetical protein